MIALLLAAATAAAPLPLRPAPAPHPVLITNPDWEHKPNGDDLARFYPAAAISAGVGGEARVKCRVNRLGGLQDCVVRHEQPAGWHFGEATVRVAYEFRMRPKTVNGQRVGDGEVEIPVRWVAPDADGVAPGPAGVANGDLDGTWRGVIGGRVQVTFKVRERSPDGSTLGSDTFGIQGLLMHRPVRAGDRVLFEADVPLLGRVAFAGRRGSDPNRLTGAWIQGGPIAPLVLTRAPARR